MKFYLSILFSFVSSIFIVTTASANDAKLHYIGVYQGSPNARHARMLKRLELRQNKQFRTTRDGEAIRKIMKIHNRKVAKLEKRNPREVIVNVEDDATNLVLVLSAYERTNWVINAKRKNINKIYLTGHKNQKIVSKTNFKSDKCTVRNNCEYYIVFHENDSAVKYEFDFDSNSCTSNIVDLESYYKEGRRDILNVRKEKMC